MQKCITCYKLKPLIDYCKSQSECSACRKIRQRKHYLVNRERNKQKAIARYYKNRDSEIERMKQYHHDNIENERLRKAKYMREQFTPEMRKTNNKRYKDNNPHKIRATKVRHRAEKLQAIPKWADLKRIEEIYKTSVRLRKFMPDKNFHVDHIIPLKGKNVCGLHVENNLRIIPAKLNIAKGNSLQMAF